MINVNSEPSYYFHYYYLSKIAYFPYVYSREILASENVKQLHYFIKDTLLHSVAKYGYLRVRNLQNKKYKFSIHSVFHGRLSLFHSPKHLKLSLTHACTCARAHTHTRTHTHTQYKNQRHFYELVKLFNK
jgi:hypothetical protein